jgi:hypothetical protein
LSSARNDCSNYLQLFSPQFLQKLMAAYLNACKNFNIAAISFNPGDNSNLLLTSTAKKSGWFKCFYFRCIISPMPPLRKNGFSIFAFLSKFPNQTVALFRQNFLLILPYQTNNNHKRHQ